ncbi:MAG: hypothetical protein ACKVZ6_08950, partial [Kineosporiaceae bacterium]
WWRRTTRVALLVALAAGTLLPAAPAFASGSRVRDVTIDCAGDVVAGHVTMTNPTTGTMRVVLYGTEGTKGNAARTQLAETTVKTVPWENEVAYRFTLSSRHKAYRVKATIGSSSRTSAAVGDPTCAPPAQVPEAGLAGLVLLVMAGAAGGVVWFRVRSAAPAGTPAG